jgi:hypothetical protein
VSAVGFRLRAELRQDWRSLLVVSLLVAIAGGACLTSLAAARRRSSSPTARSSCATGGSRSTSPSTSRRPRILGGTAFDRFRSRLLGELGVEATTRRGGPES